MEEGVTNQLSQCGAGNPPLPFYHPWSAAQVCGRACSSLTLLPFEANSTTPSKSVDIDYLYAVSPIPQVYLQLRTQAFINNNARISIAQNSLLILVFSVYEIAPARALLASLSPSFVALVGLFPGESCCHGTTGEAEAFAFVHPR